MGEKVEIIEFNPSVYGNYFRVESFKALEQACKESTSEEFLAQRRQQWKEDEAIKFKSHQACKLFRCLKCWKLILPDEEIQPDGDGYTHKLCRTKATVLPNKHYRIRKPPHHLRRCANPRCGHTWSKHDHHLGEEMCHNSSLKNQTCKCHKFKEPR